MKGTFKAEEWLDLSSESWREYTFPGGHRVRISRPWKLYVKQKPEGDSHRIISLNPDGSELGNYVPAGWLKLTWSPKEGQKTFDY